MATPAFRYPWRWEALDFGLLVPSGPADDVAHFVALQEDRDKALEDYLANLKSGSGKRFDTVVVGNPDSFFPDPAQFDYVTTGSGDQSVIGQALSDINTSHGPDFNQGGRIVLMDGTYYVSGSIDTTGTGSGGETQIVGMGENTIIVCSGNIDAFVLGNNCLLSDVFIKGQGSTGVGVLMSGTFATVRDVRVQSFNGTGGRGIDFQSPDGRAQRCDVNDNYHGVKFSSGGCHLDDSTMSAQTQAGVYVTATASSGRSSSMRGCTCYRNSKQGLDIDGGDDFRAEFNQFIANSDGAAGTYDEIYLHNAAVDNWIHNNRCRKGTITANRYAVRIDNDGSTGNHVLHNDLKTGGGTGIISDPGALGVFNLDGSANVWNRVA